jgi:hypothetical protein
MRKFLVGACCVIVGLQFVAAVVGLIGLAVLAAMGGVRVPTVVQYDGPPTPVSPPVQRAAWDAPAAAVPATRVAPDPLVETILEYRQQVGSPLAGTILADDPASPDVNREISSILAEVSAQAVAEPIGTSAASESPSLAPPPPEIVNSQLALPSPLALAAEHLYKQAGRHESRGEFKRADELRGLARQLRRELDPTDKGSTPEIVCPDPVPEAAKPANPAEFPAADAPAGELVIPAT